MPNKKTVSPVVVANAEAQPSSTIFNYITRFSVEILKAQICCSGRIGPMSRTILALDGSYFRTHVIMITSPYYARISFYLLMVFSARSIFIRVTHNADGMVGKQSRKFSSSLLKSDPRQDSPANGRITSQENVTCHKIDGSNLGRTWSRKRRGDLPIT